MTYEVTWWERKAMGERQELAELPSNELRRQYIDARVSEYHESKFSDEDHGMHVAAMYTYKLALTGNLKERANNGVSDAAKAMLTLEAEADRAVEMVRQAEILAREKAYYDTRAETNARRVATRQAHKLGFTQAGVDEYGTAVPLGHSYRIRG